MSKTGTQVWVEALGDGRWAVRTEGSSRADSIHDRRYDAVKRARQLAGTKNGELIIKDSVGRIIGNEYHGNDPTQG